MYCLYFLLLIWVNIWKHKFSLPPLYLWLESCFLDWLISYIVKLGCFFPSIFFLFSLFFSLGIFLLIFLNFTDPLFFYIHTFDKITSEFFYFIYCSHVEIYMAIYVYLQFLFWKTSSVHLFYQYISYVFNHIYNSYFKVLIWLFQYLGISSIFFYWLLFI